MRRSIRASLPVRVSNFWVCWVLILQEIIVGQVLGKYVIFVLPAVGQCKLPTALYLRF